MLRTQLIRALVLGAAVIGFGATTANAAIVQYDAVLHFGFADGGPSKGGNPDTANNGVPACAATNITSMGGATNARQDFRGLAEVLSAAQNAPVRLFNQTPANGFFTQCTNVNAVPGPSLTRRTGTGNFYFPAQGKNNPGTNNIAGTFVAGGGGNTTGIGGADRVVTVAWGTPGQQRIVASNPGGQKFGGAIAISGFANTILGITNMGNTLVGTLPVPINMGMSSTTNGVAASPRVVTGQQVSGAFFWLKVCGNPTIPLTGYHGTTCPVLINVNGSAAGLPWSTGTVMAYDTFGNFVTTRTRTGAPTARNSMGTTGTIQLVSPAVLGIFGLAPLGIAVTAELEMTLTPEPTSSMLFGAGALGLVGIYMVRRRKN